jgi:hypothetical protein
LEDGTVGAGGLATRITALETTVDTANTGLKAKVTALGTYTTADAVSITNTAVFGNKKVFTLSDLLGEIVGKINTIITKISFKTPDSITESKDKFATKKTYTFGDFATEVVGKINWLISRTTTVKKTGTFTNGDGITSSTVHTIAQSGNVVVATITVTAVANDWGNSSFGKIGGVGCPIASQYVPTFRVDGGRTLGHIVIGTDCSIAPWGGLATLPGGDYRMHFSYITDSW